MRIDPSACARVGRFPRNLTSRIGPRNSSSVSASTFEQPRLSDSLSAFTRDSPILEYKVIYSLRITSTIFPLYPAATVNISSPSFSVISCENEYYLQCILNILRRQLPIESSCSAPRMMKQLRGILRTRETPGTPAITIHPFPL